MRDLLDFYLSTMKNAVVVQFQYRAANYFFMIGMIAEPIIYLVVWSSVARAQGGQVAGYTPGSFAAYYIVWTLVRNMNLVYSPYAWEDRIQRGRLSSLLLRPLHPLHYDLAFFAGWKVVNLILWLPLALILSLLFKPELSPTPLEMVVFFIAIWGAYLIRSMFLWILGLVSLWTTRVAALFELYFVLELLLSGRLVPMALLPTWARSLANYFPFQWTFGFPIEVLVGQLSPPQMLLGLGAQLAWTLVGLLIIQIMWRAGIRRYSAVGA